MTDLIQIQAGNVATASAMAREVDALRAAIITAKHFPRNEEACRQAIMAATRRPMFAANASYVFPRGGQAVTGGTVKFARELAKLWRNINHGYSIVESTEEDILIKGFAIDLEANVTVTRESRFKTMIYRKKDGWIKAEDRDLRELIAKQAALLVRNCIFEILPCDLVQEAEASCKATAAADSANALKSGKEDVIKALIKSFESIDVSVVMLQEYLSHDLKDLDALELTNLREIFAGIRDGQAKRSDYFKVTSENKSKIDELNAVIGSKIDKLNAVTGAA